MRKTASLVGIVFGSIFVIAGIVTWIVITNTLSDQKITVSDDAGCRAGATVAGPVSAYCQASVIDKHTMEITGGKTYAELDREDPNRDTAMTSSFLQASLFTSVVALVLRQWPSRSASRSCCSDSRCASRSPLPRAPQRSRDRASCSSRETGGGGVEVQAKAGSEPCDSFRLGIRPRHPATEGTP